MYVSVNGSFLGSEMEVYVKGLRSGLYKAQRYAEETDTIVKSILVLEKDGLQHQYIESVRRKVKGETKVFPLDKGEVGKYNPLRQDVCGKGYRPEAKINLDADFLLRIL